jgi:acetoin utilization protein AcuB
MSTPALCGRTEHTLQQAWATMSKYEIHHLAIVDEQMTLRGMLSSNRLLEFLLEQDGASPRETLLKTLLEQLCQGTVLSTGPQVAVGELAASMLAMGLDGVPVCRSGELVGMVTFSDIVRTSLGRSTLDVNA